MPSNSLEDAIRNFLAFLVFIMTSICTIFDCIDRLKGRGLSESKSNNEDNFIFDESSLYDDFENVFGKGSAKTFKKKHKKNKKVKGKKMKKIYSRMIV